MHTSGKRDDGLTNQKPDITLRMVAEGKIFLVFEYFMQRTCVYTLQCHIVLTNISMHGNTSDSRRMTIKNMFTGSF